jgi:hypothetical protein
VWLQIWRHAGQNSGPGSPRSSSSSTYPRLSTLRFGRILEIQVYGVGSARSPMIILVTISRTFTTPDAHPAAMEADSRRSTRNASLLHSTSTTSSRKSHTRTKP